MSKIIINKGIHKDHNIGLPVLEVAGTVRKHPVIFHSRKRYAEAEEEE